MTPLDRLQAATEGSKELDGRIVLALDISLDHPNWPYVIEQPDGTVVVDQRVPRYTTSLDAALTLVPEGCWYSIQYRADYRDETTALIEQSLARVPGNRPALALCIAALKARQETT